MINCCLVATRTPKLATLGSFGFAKLGFHNQLWYLSPMRTILQVLLLCSVLGCFGLTDTSRLFGQHPLAHTYDGTAQYDPRSCVCGNDPQHYPNIITDVVLPAHPGTIFNLMYSYHNEIKDFWAQQGMHGKSLSKPLRDGLLSCFSDQIFEPLDGFLKIQATPTLASEHERCCSQ
jgi:hypothetical protein